MFLPLSRVRTVWESEDALVRAGSGMLAGEIRVGFAWLGGREIGLTDIRGLNGFMATLKPGPKADPLVLLSQTLGFRADPEAEARGMVLEVGRYRRYQQAFREAGGRLVSVAHGVVVGGTYMAHGLAAPHRLVTEGTRIYGALPPSATRKILGKEDGAEGQSLADALALGLVTEVLPEEELTARLNELLRNCR